MLPHLTLRALRTVGFVALGTLLFAFLGILVRLLPFIVSPDVPTPISLAFFRSVAPASIEAALLLALPLGCCLEVVRWVNDGSAMTLRTLGSSPLRQTQNVALVALFFSAACMIVSARTAALAGSPGLLPTTLLDRGSLHVCEEGRPARVPIVDMVWICIEGIPRLVGRFPTDGEATVAFTATSTRFSDPLDRLEMSDVRGILKPNYSLRAETVVITGFVPWMGSSNISPWLRAVAAATTALFATLASTWALLHWTSASRARAVVVAVMGTIGFLTLGTKILESYSWAGLVPLTMMGIGAPVLTARLARNPQLPESPPDGTKRGALNTS